MALVVLDGLDKLATSQPVAERDAAIVRAVNLALPFRRPATG
jgi:hypothetical protein